MYSIFKTFWILDFKPAHNNKEHNKKVERHQEWSYSSMYLYIYIYIEREKIIKWH